LASHAKAGAASAKTTTATQVTLSTIASASKS
jgi:hypothetical protein